MSFAARLTFTESASSTLAASSLATGASFTGFTVMDTVATLLVRAELSSMVYVKLSEIVSEPLCV